MKKTTASKRSDMQSVRRAMARFGVDAGSIPDRDLARILAAFSGLADSAGVFNGDYDYAAECLKIRAEMRDATRPK